MPRAPPVTTATWLFHVIAVLPLDRLVSLCKF
jgi:hypothetical protein